MKTTFSRYDPPPPGEFGFRLVAGPPHGLSAFMIAVGRLPPDGPRPGHPLHLHHGDEVCRIISGEIVTRIGEERRACGPGDVLVMPPEIPHGMLVITETVLQVITQLGAGTAYPVITPDGERRFVDVYRRDIPWTQQPPDGNWTSDERLAEILAAVDGAV